MIRKKLFFIDVINGQLKNEKDKRGKINFLDKSNLDFFEEHIGKINPKKIVIIGTGICKIIKDNSDKIKDKKIKELLKSAECICQPSRPKYIKKFDEFLKKYKEDYSIKD